jgi:hypothetical protein
MSTLSLSATIQDDRSWPHGAEAKGCSPFRVSGERIPARSAPALARPGGAASPERVPQMEDDDVTKRRPGWSRAWSTARAATLIMPDRDGECRPHRAPPAPELLGEGAEC